MATKIHQIFKEFLEYLDQIHASFTVGNILPDLLSFDVITVNEEVLISHLTDPFEKTKVLFLYIMPTKNEECHFRLVSVLQKHQMTDLAHYLQKKLDQQPSKSRSSKLNEGDQLVQDNVLTTSVLPPDITTDSHLEQLSSPILSIPSLDTNTIKTAQIKELTRKNSKFLKQTNPEGWEKELKTIDKVPVTKGLLDFKHVQKFKGLPLHADKNNYYHNCGDAKGLVIVINCQLSRGSAIDSENIQNLFETLGYKAKQCHDISEIEAALAQNGYSERDTLRSIIVVLSALTKDGYFINESNGTSLEITSFFRAITKNKKFEGIPKIFVIQACRESVQVSAVSEKPSRSDIKECEWKSQGDFLKHIPNCDETCIIYSITPGYYTWHLGEHGSWFVQSICETFSKHAHEPWADLMTLITTANEQFSTAFNEQSCLILMSAMMVNMDKTFHFFPKYTCSECQEGIVPLAAAEKESNLLATSVISECSDPGYSGDDDLFDQYKNRPITVMAVGKTGKGKSSTLNSLIRLVKQNNPKSVDIKYFETEEGSNSVSNNVTSVDIHPKGFPTIRLIDTIGLFDPNLTTEEKNELHFEKISAIDKEHEIILQQFVQMFELSKEGVDAFLFVLKATDRATKEEMETINIIFRYLGWNMLDYVIFVVTTKDEASQKSFEAWKNHVCDLLERKGYPKERIKQRFFFIDNKHPTEEQALELLSLVLFVNDINYGKPFTHATFEVAQKSLEEAKQSLKNELEKEFQVKIDKTLKPIEERHQKQISTLELQIMRSQEEAAKLRTDQTLEGQKYEADIAQLKRQLQEEARKLEEQKMCEMERLKEQQRHLYDYQRSNMEMQIRQLQMEMHAKSSRNQMLLAQTQREKARKGNAGKFCRPMTYIRHTIQQHWRHSV